jgi:inhibitor of cysteine peptidase
MHIMQRLAPALTLLTALALATATLDAAFGDKTVTLTDKDIKDAKVELAKGDKLVVKVASNKTTGFSWVVASKENDMLKWGKSEYQAPEKGKPGAGGTEIFTFTAEKAGEVEIEMHYKRSFEKDKEPAKTYKFKVTIK